jgi:signal peptidase I
LFAASWGGFSRTDNEILNRTFGRTHWKEGCLLPKIRRPAAEKSPLREFLETILGAAALAAFIMIFIARAYTVDGPSMLPTLINGERLMVDKITYRIRPPRRGEIVVFRYPANPKESFIKRVIGVPGDTIQIYGGVVYVNEESLAEDYLGEAFYGRFGPRTVPENAYFVLGDNRNNSEDSRDPRVDFVPRSMIVGRAIWRYWPIPRMSIIRLPEAFRTSS